MNPKGETEETLNLALAVKENIPQKPKRKPTQDKTPPLPEKKPETPLEREKRKQEAKVRLKKRWKDIKDIVKLAGRSTLGRLLFPLEMTLE